MRYQILRNEPSWCVEIYIPKKAAYQKILFSTLLAGLELDCRSYFRKYKKEIKLFLSDYYDKHSDVDGFINRNEKIFHGYSISEVHGTFYNQKKSSIDEETSQVVRIIFTPDYEKYLNELNLKKRIIDSRIRQVSKLVLNEISEEISIDSDELRFETRLWEWMHDVNVFLFGFLVREITIGINGKEQQLWVSINRNYEMHRVIKRR